jgi:hypothetical protein
MDRRELILQRLLAIMQGVTAFGSVGPPTRPIRLVARNYKLADYTTYTPALILLDGSETTPPTAIAPVRARPDAVTLMRPALARMMPQMFCVLDDRTPENINTGSDINAWRCLMVSLLAVDTGLRDLVGGSGKVDYIGIDTDMQTGSTMDGRGQLHIAIEYPVDMDELDAG